MPIRVIVYVIIMVLIALFLGVNGANSCDINLIFAKFKDVPVITTILISFAAGLFIMMPFTFRRKKTNKKTGKTISKAGKENTIDLTGSNTSKESSNLVTSASKTVSTNKSPNTKKSFFGKEKKNKASTDGLANEKK